MTIEMQDVKAVILRRNTKELVEWLEVNRKPVGRDVSRYRLENEFDKSTREWNNSCVTTL